MRPSPSSSRAPRRERAVRLLERLLLAAILVRVAQGLVRVARDGAAPTLPPPLSVDASRDPPARLVFLPGVGPKRAAAIVRDREENGPFPTLDDLDRVPGIGPGTVRSIRATPRVRARAGAEDADDR